MIIEAVTEDYDLKSKIFKEIDALLVETGKEKDVILASNTSSISLTKLASNVSNPENFIGMHFMNPVPIMQLVILEKIDYLKNKLNIKLILICK